MTFQAQELENITANQFVLEHRWVGQALLKQSHLHSEQRWPLLLKEAHYGYCLLLACSARFEIGLQTDEFRNMKMLQRCCEMWAVCPSHCLQRQSNENLGVNKCYMSERTTALI